MSANDTEWEDPEPWVYFDGTRRSAPVNQDSGNPYGALWSHAPRTREQFETESVLVQEMNFEELVEDRLHDAGLVWWTEAPGAEGQIVEGFKGDVLRAVMSAVSEIAERIATKVENAGNHIEAVQIKAHGYLPPLESGVVAGYQQAAAVVRQSLEA